MLICSKRFFLFESATKTLILTQMEHPEYRESQRHKNLIHRFSASVIRSQREVILTSQTLKILIATQRQREFLKKEDN